MSKTLDEKIFEDFLQVVESKKLLTGKNINELKAFLGKANVSAEDWELLVDKECFPAIKEQKDAGQN